MQQSATQTGIVWFNNNLRVEDNEALTAACKNHVKVIGFYGLHPDLLQPTHYGFPKMGRFRLQFLLDSLHQLRSSLEKIDIPLFVITGKPEKHLGTLVSAYKAGAVYFQEEWTYEEQQIIKAVRQNCTAPLIGSYDQFLVHPEDLPFKTMNIPEVFTAFRKACEKHWTVRPCLPVPHRRIEAVAIPDKYAEIPDPKSLGISPITKDPRTAFPFSGGCDQAQARLDYYIWQSRKITTYKHTRNGLTGRDYSTKLSPWLANGSISARQVYREVKRFEKQVIKNQDTYWVIFELLWRDFFKYISLKHGNKIFLPGGIHNRATNIKCDKTLFHKWQMGQTGDDFVDANMKELYHTGWMSNRGRQNTASFWAKTWKQDWRAGAMWFESLLIDYDVHSNWGNWMYVSGVGNDSRDRVFNTRLQAERYDGDRSYRSLWLQDHPSKTTE